MMLRIAIAVIYVFALNALGHEGHSQEYQDYLNQAKPGWLNIGSPISATIVDGAVSYQPNEEQGSVIASRKSVSIPGKNINIPFENYVSGGTSWGSTRDHWLSPDGKRLVVAIGGTTRVFEILDESYKEIDQDIPKISFDNPVRGKLYGWAWASNEILLGQSEIEDPNSGEHVAGRVYAFNVESKTLSRLMIGVDSSEGVEIVEVYQDNFLLRVGDKHILVNPNIENFGESEGFAPERKETSVPKAEPKSDLVTPSEPKQSNRSNRWVWLMLVAGLIGVGSILWIAKARKSRS